MSTDPEPLPPTQAAAILHCLQTISALVAQGRDDRRSLFQLGYNLGRLSELTGLGREPCWDAWKDPVATWDQTRLRELASQLHAALQQARAQTPGGPTAG